MFSIQNDTRSGLIVGVAVPLIGFALLLLINDKVNFSSFMGAAGDSFSFSRRTLMAIAICLNLVPFNLFRVKKMNLALQGVLLATFFGVFLYLIIYGKEIFG